MNACVYVEERSIPGLCIFYKRVIDVSFLCPKSQIHWFSLINSFMLVIFLVGVVAVILMRTLRKDFARYSKDEFIDDMVWICVLLYICYMLLRCVFVWEKYTRCVFKDIYSCKIAIAYEDMMSQKKGTEVVLTHYKYSHLSLFRQMLLSFHSLFFFLEYIQAPMHHCIHIISLYHQWFFYLANTSPSNLSLISFLK